MYRLTMRPIVALVLVSCLAVATAAEGPAIGLAMARGSFRVDNAEVWNNATLLQGTQIETGRVASELRLSSGPRVALEADSRGQVHKDRLILERGIGELQQASNYSIEARGLRIHPAESKAAARVGFDRENRVLVAALHGPVRVTTRQGLVVANLAAGMRLSFHPPQAGAAGPVKVSGTLSQKDGHFLLTDETTKVISELIGDGLSGEVGNRIEVTGSLDTGATPFPPATQVVRIGNRKRLAAIVGGGAAAAGAAAGLSTGATVAIIGGVVVGATVGTLAATDVLFSDEKTSVSN